MLELLAILGGHYLADFPAQMLGQPVMKNKHKDWRHLYLHAAVYAVVLFAATFWLPAPDWVIAGWVLFNASLHFAIDAATSRATHYLYGKGKMDWFWCVIGFDQFLHAAILLCSATSMGLM